MARRPPRRVIGLILTCADCRQLLTARQEGMGAMFASDWEGDWFMVKDHVWRRGQRAGACRFLCVGCLEDRIGRKLVADDFRRTAKVNFVGHKSAKLRRRMRGLTPGRRLVETTFKP